MKLPKTVRRRGFTIVEVLMVIAVMTILFTLVMMVSGRLRVKAYVERTKAMILQLKNGLDEYRALKGNYPPDGYDFEVKNRDGKPIWGAACLYEFLSTELVVEENVAGQVRTSKHDPIMTFKASDLTPENPDLPGIREVVDGFGLPFHYANTEDGQFKPDKQGELAHMEAAEAHPPDPRDDGTVVPRRGIQRMGAYDLWSHGSHDAHSKEDVDLHSTIGNWNVDSEIKDRSKENQ